MPESRCRRASISKSLPSAGHPATAQSTVLREPLAARLPSLPVGDCASGDVAESNDYAEEDGEDD